MNTNDLPVATVPPTTEIFPRPDEARKLSFWISQCFILVATVLGVYLASSQGFKQALAYGEVQAARSNYHLRASLRNEIVDNIGVVQSYMESIAGGAPSARQAPLNLDVFIWDCLKNSPNTLETPSDLLRESRAFYRTTQEVHGKIAAGVFSVGHGRTELQKAIDAVQKETLPKYAANLSEVRAYLDRHGVTVD